MENSPSISGYPDRCWRWLKAHLELLFWITALAVLYLMPADPGSASLCPSVLIGLGHCPGCGIGHAMHDALHLQWKTSVAHHFMGIPGLLIIFSRIIRLLYPPNKAYETEPGQFDPRH